MYFLESPLTVRVLIVHCRKLWNFILLQPRPSIKKEKKPKPVSCAQHSGGKTKSAEASAIIVSRSILRSSLRWITFYLSFVVDLPIEKTAFPVVRFAIQKRAIKLWRSWPSKRKKTQNRRFAVGAPRKLGIKKLIAFKSLFTLF